MTDFMEHARALRQNVLWQSNSSVEVIARVLRQAYERGLDDAAKVAEAYADEQDKTVKAGVIARAIRWLKEPFP